MTNLHLLAGALVLGLGARVGAQQSDQRWKAHDPDRPRPSVVEPGASVGQPPSDAIVLFDGTDLSRWATPDGSPARWIVRDGYMETTPGA